MIHLVFSFIVTVFKKFDVTMLYISIYDALLDVQHLLNHSDKLISSNHRNICLQNGVSPAMHVCLLVLGCWSEIVLQSCVALQFLHVEFRSVGAAEMSALQDSSHSREQGLDRKPAEVGQHRLVSQQFDVISNNKIKTMVSICICGWLFKCSYILY